MSLHALVGLIGFNLVLVVAGAALLGGLRGFESPAAVARLAGVAYVLGVSTLGILLVLELILGVPFGLTTVVLTAVGIAGFGVALAWARRPPRHLEPTPTRIGAAGIGTLVGAAVTVVFLEALFRSGRLSGLFEWDAMAFWVPKAKAIYYFGGLDKQFFTTLPGSTYPPLIPALDASAFTFMGSPDAITLHLQFWFLFAGFVAAVAGLLAPRVSAVALWSIVLLIATAPVVLDYAVSPLADLPLDYLVALAALLLALWLVDGAQWQIAVAGLLLAGAVLTKREGLLLSMCVLIAAAVAARGRRRPSRLLLLAAVCAVAALPWRLWYGSHGLSGEGPETGYFGFVHHLGRAWPSLRLTLQVLFDGSFWFVLPFVLLLALLAAAAAGSFALVRFAGAYLVLATLACSWVTLSFPSIPITTNAAVNPIVRLSGGLVLPLAAVVPLLVDAAWGRRVVLRVPVRAAWTAFAERRRVVAAVVAAAACAYPAAILATDGLPRFPSARDCEAPVTHDGPIELLLGLFPSTVPAERQLPRLRKLGYVQAKVMPDGCGRVAVAVPGYTSLASAKNAVAEARRAGVRARAVAAGS